ncbi:hypothetical protein N836_26565 [Leptolyngbya sp. Heron Island J]|uniref:hypothetical protein n=1 Tax=Leptolyngbya sp. Heron Island J TaxID=1385935 RepID=UPI0003B9C45D|nr:hypothetical protein [Leptolyngbya sp. Heron Island J]ESA32157.1 hypothetical protein N836_26565 [Leptolyngbya sp. Heron Island J]
MNKSHPADCVAVSPSEDIRQGNLINAEGIENAFSEISFDDIRGWITRCYRTSEESN